MGWKVRSGDDPFARDTPDAPDAADAQPPILWGLGVRWVLAFAVIAVVAVVGLAAMWSSLFATH